MKKNTLIASLVLLLAGCVAWKFVPKIPMQIGSYDAGGHQFTMEYPDTPCHITTGTTTACKATSGAFRKLLINGPISLATIKIYDVAGGSCTGTPGSGLVAAVTMPLTLTNPPSFDYNVIMNNGICVVTSGATDVTVTFQ